MTNWGTALIIAFLALGLSGAGERKAYRWAIGLAATLLLAVSVGVL